MPLFNSRYDLYSAHRHPDDLRPRGRGGYDRGFEREYDRSFQRPGVGGYRGGYQGGSGGIPTGGHPSGGRDYWWIGEHAYGRSDVDRGYDARFRAFDRDTHPRYSPVGGMHAAMGGEYRYRQPPRPLRDDTWFSEWTRWF